MGGLKRTVTYDGPPRLNKRLRRMETQIRRNRPEMKNKIFSSSANVAAGALTNQTLTNIDQGDDIDERIGNNIRIWRIEVRGNLAVGLDQLVVQQHTTTSPTYASFTTTQGAMIIASNTNSLFTEWHHYNTRVSSGEQFRYFVKFPKGMVVHFNGTAGTSGCRNEVALTTVNNTAGTLGLSYNARVWYTDA